ncbi:MAG TPA: YncE family protein [Bacteroidetes bacterium]|nr:YncE family protein [Bacteroidota bacterium]
MKTSPQNETQVRRKPRSFPLLLLVLLSLIFTISCKEKPIEQPEKVFENGIFILNEGNFQGGNSSLSFLHQPGDSLSHKIFRTALGRPLGDVAQSIQIRQDKAWIVVNNSGKIEVIDLPKLDPHCTISGLISPRYLHFISANKAYVTDLYSRNIAIIDPQNCTVTGHISTGGWTEAILAAENKIFVAQMGTDKILVIDPITDLLLDSISVGREPNSLVRAANGQIWVLCSGGLSEAMPKLLQINPLTHVVTAGATFSNINESPNRLRINAAGDRLYWLNTDVYTQLADSNDVQSRLISAGSRTFYGLEIASTSGELSVLNARDYVQAGELLQFSASGQALGSYGTGIIPSTLVYY